MRKFDRARANLWDDAARGALSLIARFHHFLQRIERGGRLPRARDEEGELADRGERPSGEHHDRDDRAHRHFAGIEAIEAADQKADADELLRYAGQVYGNRGQPPHPLLRRRRHGRIAPPAAQHLSFGPRCLQRLDARNRLNQNRMLQARIGLRIERRPSHPFLQHDPGEQHQRHTDQRDKHQPARKDGDQDQENHQEADVDHQHHRCRRKEVANILIFGHAPRERAGAALALGHGQVHHLLE